RARTTYRDENKGTPFVQDDAWEILRLHAKLDASSPVEQVDLTGGEQVLEVGYEELFGEDARPRTPGPRKAPPTKKANPMPRRVPREVTRQTHSGAYVNRISS
ncbi:hypothetical protein Tco_0753034, partial [Tanacetum coccineum]